MLSRLSLTRNAAGNLSILRLTDGQQGMFGMAIMVRKATTSTTSATTDEKPKPVVAEAGDIKRTLANWEAANKLYFGPERDTVNFPIKVRPEKSPPVRLGFIPDSWFQAFYNKTGVTGPYMFGAGFLTYVLSKEWWVVEHNFTHFLSFWIAIYIIASKYGSKIAEYFDNHGKAIDDKNWWKPINKAKEFYTKDIEEQEKAIWREDGQKYLFEAKRENVDLQLESIYRQRLNEVHQAVKKRLDYMVDVEGTQRRLQQQHMVQWIVNGVMTGITPQQEKDSLTKCIQDLKALSAKAAKA